MMRENDGRQKKRNLLFHSECMNQPVSVEPATEEVFDVELKDRKNKPLKLNPKEKKTGNHPQPSCLSKCFYPRLLERFFFKKEKLLKARRVPSACRLDKPSNCLGWRCSSRFPAAWNHPIGGWKKSSGKNSRKSKSRIWEQVHPGWRLLGLMMFFSGQLFLEAAFTQKKSGTFQWKFSSKGMHSKKKLATLHSSKPSV